MARGAGGAGAASSQTARGVLDWTVLRRILEKKQVLPAAMAWNSNMISKWVVRRSGSALVAPGAPRRPRLLA